MPWMSSCNAPDLTGLSNPVLGNYLLEVALTGRGGSNDRQVLSYAHAFILGVDRVVRAYNAGRSALIAYTQSHNRTVLLFEGLGDFDTCITTVHRCLALAERM